jgi:hypothetical protein
VRKKRRRQANRPKADHFLGEAADRLPVRNIEKRGHQAWVRGNRLVEHFFPTASDHDLISLSAKCLGEPSAYPGASARDQNRVPGELHDVFSSVNADWQIVAF